MVPNCKYWRGRYTFRPPLKLRLVVGPSQGTEGGLATSVPGQDVEARGILASTATRDQHTLTSVAPAGHLGSTCQQAGLTKPPRRQKKKKQKQLSLIHI